MKYHLALMYSDRAHTSPINPLVKMGWGDSKDPLDENCCFVEHMIADGRIEPYNFSWADITESGRVTNLYNLRTGERLQDVDLGEVVDGIWLKGFGKEKVESTQREDIVKALGSLQASFRGPTINPVETVLWYKAVAKQYLKDLLRKGIKLPPTTFATSFDEVELARKRWGDVVVKPVIGFAGLGIQRYPGGDQTTTKGLLEKDGEVIVQRFLPEVTTLGERAIYLFDSEVSYAVQKLPLEGEYLCNSAKGSSREIIEATPQEIAYAKQVTQALGKEISMIRVDLIGPRDDPGLMEVALGAIGLYPRETKREEEIGDKVIEFLLNKLTNP